MAIARRTLLLALPAALLAAPRTAKLAAIDFEFIRNGRSKRRYLLIHGGETTARAVLREHMRTHKGAATLVTGLARNIQYGAVAFDPNRIWSRDGAARNLARLNPKAAPADIEAALGMFDRERPKLLKAVLPPKGGVLIATHNNSEGYSVDDEVAISDKVALNDKQNNHEFFLTTSPIDYDRIARGPYNVVLQQKAPPDDDGSLSRLAASRGFRYVNLEVGLGKFDKQKEMLNWLEGQLP